MKLLYAEGVMAACLAIIVASLWVQTVYHNDRIVPVYLASFSGAFFGALISIIAFQQSLNGFRLLVTSIFAVIGSLLVVGSWNLMHSPRKGK